MVIPLPNPYVIGTGTSLTTGGSQPTVTLAGVTRNGTIYGGSALDGTASQFLFGDTTNDDAQFDFDARFGSNYGSPIPAAGIAIYKFAAVQLTGNPMVQTAGGPVDFAIVAQSGITAGGGGGTWALNGLRSLTLVTENGPIQLSNEIGFSAAAASGFQFLHVYGRGGNVNLGGSFNLPGGALLVDSTNNVVVANTGTITARDVVLFGEDAVQIAGAVNGGLVQIWSAGQVTLAGPISGTDVLIKTKDLAFNGAGASLVADNITLDVSGSFAAGAVNSFIRGRDVIVRAANTFALNTISTATTRLDLSNLGRLRVEAKRIDVQNSVTMTPGSIGILSASGGELNASGFDLLNFEHLATNSGPLKARNVDTRYLSVRGGNLEVSGDLSVENAIVDGDLKVAGKLKARNGAAPAGGYITTAKKFEILNGIDFKGTDAPLLGTATDGGHLVLASTYGDINFDTSSGAILNANFDGGSSGLLSLGEGGNGGTFEIGTDAQPTAGKITLKTGISATTGANGVLTSTGGKGGTVAMVSADTVTAESTIKVSDSAAGRASKEGGKISIKSTKTGGTAIAINSSAQLLSLLSGAAAGPGGTIKITSAGGDIDMSGTARADKGTVEITNNGSASVVNITNANLRGNTVKVGALGADGTLNVGGGTMSADSLIHLYAGGSNGTVNFTDNVTLSGNSVKTISGNMVTIRDGKIVTVTGPAPASVFTNNPNYTGSGGNGSTTGVFGGQGATTAPLSSGPGY